ncbi:MGMT family protein [Candidatus Woesearchaeota archaeon]|nr:MGMT family protein [Candidatus Woesearchaeota archaeon]
MTFSEQVYVLCRKIPRGRVTTYKILAEKLGIKGYQAIGQALRCNPYASDVPCHRVIASNGSIGGFKGKREGKEIDEKVRLLKGESVLVIQGEVDLHQYLYSFS